MTCNQHRTQTGAVEAFARIDIEEKCNREVSRDTGPLLFSLLCRAGVVCVGK